MKIENLVEHKLAYYTIKDIERILPDEVYIVSVETWNSWVTIFLTNNLRIKIKYF